MSKRKPKPTTWQGRIKAELLRDKKKTGILTALALVGLVVGVRLTLSGSTPEETVAAPTAAAVEDGNSGDGARSAMGTRPPTDRSVARARWAEYLATMDRKIDRDLFKLNRSCFMPRAGETPADAGSGDPGWLGTVMERVAAKQRERSDERSRVRAIRGQAEALSLQSVMMVGEKPTALINGQVLRRGDSVGGFRIEEIRLNRCVVSKNGVKIELRMD